MRIGLYGLPTAGKTFILDAVRNFEVLAGSSLLKTLAPNFHTMTAEEKTHVRKQLAEQFRDKDNFIMDGHYSFGDEVAFTDEDGELYDIFLYLYVDPAILKKRMEDSVRNRKYLAFDVEKWQMFEVESLRRYCHEHNKDFYVLDNPEKGYFPDVSVVLEFIDSLAAGYSCVSYARKCAETILKKTEVKLVCLADGDKTLIIEDSSAVLGYKTHIFDGNFYTGFQAWRHNREMTDFLRSIDWICPSFEKLGIHFNRSVIERIKAPCFVLTAGHYGIWKEIANELKMPMYCGEQMSAETKYFIAKFLQEQGVRIVAYGDSMNDYYMLKQADEGYLIAKADGTLSRSLKHMDTEGITVV
ncbi:MAG: AAA family ATPase [Bacilli bacterium]|nr:AAA family ATPase [Bacilli bacterium]